MIYKTGKNYEESSRYDRTTVALQNSICRGNTGIDGVIV